MKKNPSPPQDLSWKNTLFRMLEKEVKTMGGKPMKVNNKQRQPVAHIRDLIDDLPLLLKDLGLMKCIETILCNLYLMNPRPEDPSKEIHNLLEEAMGSSSYAKVERWILEREQHKQLLHEFRIRQEIGKLKALCHLLLPEEYGPNGEILAPETIPQPPQDYVLKELEELKPHTSPTGEDNPLDAVELGKKGKRERRKSKSSSRIVLGKKQKKHAKIGNKK